MKLTKKQIQIRRFHRHSARFHCYIFLKTKECMILLQEHKLSHDEMESALYPLFLEEKKEKKESIDRFMELGKQMVQKIMRNVNGTHP